LSFLRLFLYAFFLGISFSYSARVWAGAQQQEVLSDSLRAVLSAAFANDPPPNPGALQNLSLKQEFTNWFGSVRPVFDTYLNSHFARRDYAELSTTALRDTFLETVWYESKRAGLDPSLVLAIIEVESGFNKFAISSAGAVGYMQVMPFWVALTERDLQPHLSELRSREMQRTRQIEREREKGDDASKASAKLFHLQTNIRFGCVILRHYLDLEREDFIRALGRYNGNMQDKSYANTVLVKRVEWAAKTKRDRLAGGSK